jgi:hypothetical protein
MRRAYRCLLRLYPAEYRALFGDEMLALLGDATEEQLGRGWMAFVCLAGRELTGLAVGGSLERIAKLRNPGDYLDGLGADETLDAEATVKLLVRRMEYAISHHQFHKARYYAEMERREREKLC